MEGQHSSVMPRRLPKTSARFRLGIVWTVTLASRPIKTIVETPSADHMSIARVLAGLSSREGATDFTEALSIIAPRLQEPGLDHEIRLISDFRKGSIHRDNPPSELNAVEGATVEMLVSPPTTQPRSNVQIESIEVARNPASTTASGGVGLVRVSIRPAPQWRNA